MNSKYAVLVPLVMLAAACGRQDARPLIGPDAKAFAASTGTVKIAVLRDTANSRTVPKFVAGGFVRVNLYEAGDPTKLVRTALTNSAGEVFFTGLAPGNYILRDSLRAKSTSLIPAGGTPITVTAGDTVTTDTVRVRLSTRISGIARTDFLNQTKLTTVRHAGLKVVLLRETGVATNVYVPVDSTVTNGVGFYEFFATAGPERLRVQFNSGDITNFNEATTLGGAAPPFTKKVETINLTAANPGGELTGTIQFSIPARITGRVYRDKNGNGIRDSILITPAVVGPPPRRALGTKEGLVAGDSIRIQLLNAAGTKVITTTLVTAGAVSSEVPTRDSIGFNIQVPLFTFSSVEPGSYVLKLDKLGSRFPSNPLEFIAGPAYEVLVPTPTTSAVTATCRPLGSTAAFGSCDFVLVSGQ